MAYDTSQAVLLRLQGDRRTEVPGWARLPEVGIEREADSSVKIQRRNALWGSGVAWVVPALPHLHALRKPKPGMGAGRETFTQHSPSVHGPVLAPNKQDNGSPQLQMQPTGPPLLWALGLFHSTAFARSIIVTSVALTPSDTPSLLQDRELQSLQLHLRKLLPFTAPSCLPYDGQTWSDFGGQASPESARPSPPTLLVRVCFEKHPSEGKLEIH